MLVPIHSHTHKQRWATANYVRLGSMALTFGLEHVMSRSTGLALSLGGSAVGWVTHMWLHVNWLHLVGNGIFLWTFGNAVNARLGHGRYLGLFLVCGLAAALTHRLTGGGLAVGASGAINGIVGAYLVLYPTARITMLFWVYFHTRTFQIAGFWMILLWLGFDIYGAATGQGVVAYAAHLGGFAVGAGAALAMLASGWLPGEPGVRSFVDVVRRRPAPDDEDGSTQPVPAAPAARPSDVVWVTPMPDPTGGPAWAEPAAPRVPPAAPRPATPARPRAAEPAATARPAPASSRPGTALSGDHVVRLVCTCGWSLRMPRRTAGPGVDCPRCRTWVATPRA